MTKTIHLERKDMPEMLLRAFPDYRGRKYEVSIVRSVTLQAGSEGGTYSDYRAVNLETGAIAPPKVDLGSPHSRGEPTVEIPPRVAIVEHGRFVGHDTGLRIYIRPEDAQLMLPAGDEITDDEAIVLHYTAGLKSSYAGMKDYRFSEAERETGISRTRWEIAKADLIMRGLLNKAGAITTAGKNARRPIKRHG